MNHGKIARDADTITSEADAMAAKVCKSLQNEHEQRAKYFKEGKIHRYSLKDTVRLERHRKDVLTRHRQQSWYMLEVIVHKCGQDVCDCMPSWWGTKRSWIGTIHNSNHGRQIPARKR